MKKFLKIVLFAILSLSLISISDTKINYLNNNNEVEKVKSPKKNAIGDVNSIQDLTDLSYTKWQQISNVSYRPQTLYYFYSTSNSKIKICDIINYDNEKEKEELFSYIDKTNNNKFGAYYNEDSKKFQTFWGTRKDNNNSVGISLYTKNIIKFYDMSTFKNTINNENQVNRFLNFLKTSFSLVDESAYIKVNDNFTTNREELDKNFKHISIKGLSQTFNLNEKINISSLLENQSINEIEISIVYNDLPTTIYNLFNIKYPILSDASKKYTLTGNVQKQWGDLTRTLKFKINNRDLDDTTLEIDFFTYQHTINALRGKSFVLNTNINLPKQIKGSTDYYIDIKPAFAYTDVVQPGFYVSYVYNQNKVLNEYMDVYSTNYYKYFNAT